MAILKDSRFDNRLLVALFVIVCISIKSSYGQELECGVRPPRPPVNPDTPKYGPHGWDNPQVARREDFPWQIGIFRKIGGIFRYECGGTLIPWRDDQVLVLTGARCVTEKLESVKAEPDLRKLRIVVSPYSSNYNKNSHDFGAQKFAIKRIEINPLYETKSYDSDVAILQIDGDVSLGPLAFPVCLPPDNSERMGVRNGMIGEIAGFGWDTRRNITESLRYARYPIVMTKTCQNKLGVKVNDYLEFCTGFERDATACQGDYGGGFTIRSPKIQGRYFLQGLLSNLDATPVTPEGYCENYNVFKRIGPFLEWIKETQVKLATETRVELVPKAKPTPGFPLNYVPEFAKIARDFHNHVRAVHKAPTVRLVGRVQEEAQRLAEELVEEDVLEPPNDEDYPYSSNLYAIPRLVTAQDAVREAMDHWYRGYTKYNREDPRPSAFTQMVWKSSSQIGVGVATNGKKTVVVVNYWPKGNILYKGTKDYLRKKSFTDNVTNIRVLHQSI